MAASLLLSCGTNSSNSSSSSESSKNQTEAVNTTKVDSTVESKETTTETTTVSSTESTESSTESSESFIETSESSTESSESSTESSSSTTEEVKYTVNFVGENVSASIIGTKEEFASGEEVMFNYSVTYGYKITSFTIKDASGADVEYAETSFVTFTMPASNVTVSFFTVARHTLSLTNGEHSSITVTDQKDYYDEGDVVNFSVTFEEGYELDTLKVYKVVDGADTEVTYQTVEANYSFAFVGSNMKIVLVDKAKPVSSDPFTVKTSYQGDWDYYDGYDTTYTMYLRIVFNGDKTLSWYLNYLYYDEYYAYIPLKAAVYAAPSDMMGSPRDSGENLPYTYDRANEKITFTTKIKSSNMECSIKLNKEGEEIKTITFETQMGDEYYQTGNRTLKKI